MSGLRKTIRPIRQSADNNCGQACIAMAAGVSVRSVEALIGSGRTNVADLMIALGHFGFICGERLFRVSRQKGWFSHCILASRDHWALCWNGIIIDPGGGYYPGSPLTFTAFLPIYGRRLTRR